MVLTIDTQACALYVKLRDGDIASTKEILPDVFVDYNSKKEIIGIDLVSPCVATIRKLAKKLRLPMLKHIRKPLIDEISQM